MIQVIYYILFIITLLYGLYFLVTSITSFMKVKPKTSSHEASTKFAILIPARNEAKVIDDLIESLKKQNYPKNLFDIYALINNCNDNTEEIAKKSGAKIMKIDTPVKSKGDVLKYAFKKLKKTDYDAYLIFDADNIVHPDFVQIMNDTFLSGYKVAQGRKDSKNLQDNWLSASYTIFYYIQNLFFNKSRMNIDAASAINGTGFMVAKSVIDSGFEPKTITEDIELSIMCVLKDINVAYIESAITYDEQPTKFKDSWHQRSRWSKGIIDCHRLYRKQLLIKGIKERNFSCIDKLLFTAAPYFQVLSLILTIVLFLFRIFNIQLNDIFSYMYSLGFLCFLIFYVASVIVNIYVITYYDRDPYESMSGILLFIIFIISWIPINVICFCKKDLKWVPIEHNKKNNINEI